MKRVCIIFLLIFLACQFLHAADEDGYYTDNHINGRFWKRLKFDEKIYYLYGIVDGVTTISKSKAVFDEAHHIDPAVSEHILRSSGRFFVPGGTYRDIIQYIDDFYADDAKITTPVYAVYSAYLAEQKEWATLDSWDEQAGKLRSKD